MRLDNNCISILLHLLHSSYEIININKYKKEILFKEILFEKKKNTLYRKKLLNSNMKYVPDSFINPFCKFCAIQGFSRSM